MSNYGVPAIDHPCIVFSFIIHSDIQAENVGHIDRPAHAALIRTDDHHMIAVDLQALHIVEQALDELIGRLYGFKAMQRDGIHDSRIMCVKGNDIVNAHIDHFLQCECTVERFPGGSFALPAFIKKWHNDGNSSGFTADGGDNTFQILIVIIGRHMVSMSAQRIGQAVIGNIH